MNESDEALAGQARTGNRQAFEVLVQRHKEPLYRFCRRYIGNADDASDVLQDAFVAAWMGLQRYDERRPFAAWLQRITLNKCRDFGRRGLVRRLFLARFEREQPTEAALTEDGATFDPHTERLARLDREIAALPPAYKEALLLTTLGGMSHLEAAEQLGISVKAVEMRIYRAKQRLTELMNDEQSHSH
ncbi:RNA polymerase sigma factor [Lichenicola cladoniae]|uniref:RNA polymerase sigma factor n=1 Tax=Lichenicola cladoniae TaxID=1484109 RepID=A0A6M8HLI0_9PROT|nr:RNA polymerase sigma factor [Lichenicola cladoniae]QKE89207.1 RNA polymerase sigma factor [Lichenicola cladoniae]